MSDASSWRHEKLSYVGDITALAFTPSRRHILVGSGSSVLIHQASSLQLLHSLIDALGGQKIHGFRFVKIGDALLVVVFGGKLLRICSLIESSSGVVLNPMREALSLDHWIFDIRFVNSQCNCNSTSNESALPVSIADLHLVAALSNNSIASFSLSQSFSVHPIRTFKCIDRTLVFSMRICLLPCHDDRTTSESSGEFGCQHRIAIASGTAFSRILLWSTPSAANCSAQSVDCDVQCSLLGHQGPIFDIQWDTSGTQLCSVSDDRSVRYWRLNRALSHSDPPVTLQRTSAGYGHTSRVWRCAFLSTDALTWVVSSGEDGTLRFWHAETGSLLHTIDTQQKNCWALASAENVMAVAGTDSTVKLIDASVLVNSELIVQGQSASLPLLTHLQLSGMQHLTFDFAVHKSIAQDTIRGVVFESDDSLLCITQSGKVIRFKLNTDSEPELVFVDSAAVFSSFAVNQRLKLSALGDQRGIVTLVSLNSGFSATSFNAHKVNVMTLLFLDDQICTGDALGNIRLWRTDCSETTISTSLVAQFYIPKGLHVSSAVFIPHNSLGFLVVGDQRGNVYLFSLPSSGLFCVAGSIEADLSLPPVDVLPNFHHNERISHLVWDQDSRRVLSVGRDARLGVLELDVLPIRKLVSDMAALESVVGADHGSKKSKKKNSATSESVQSSNSTQDAVESKYAQFRNSNPDAYVLDAKLKCLDSIKVAQISNIERVFLSNSAESDDEENVVSSDVTLAGFYGSQLVVWNLSRNREIFRFEVGGGRRPFDVQTHSFNQSVNIVLSYESRVSVLRHAADSGVTSMIRSINFPFHKRLINDVACVCVCDPNSSGSSAVLAITASDDRLLKVLTWDPSLTNQRHNIQHLATLQGHVDMIRCVALSPCHHEYQTSFTQLQHCSNSMLVVSAGGKQHIRCVRITASPFKTEPVASIGGDAHSDQNQSDVLDDRILSIAAAPLPSSYSSTSSNVDGRHVVVTGDSTGRMKVYLLSELDGRFEILHVDHQHGRPILQLRCFVHQLQDHSISFCVATGTTDGKVRVFDLSACIVCALNELHLPQSDRDQSRSLQPIFEQRSHSAGINGLALDYHQNSLFIATGSDDQSLCILEFRVSGVDSHTALALTNTHRRQSAHSSAIRCVDLVRLTHSLVLFSSGYDQRLIAWSLPCNSDLKFNGLLLLDSPDVASISARAIDDCNIDVTVCGANLQTVRFHVE